MHNGIFNTLEEVIDFYASGGGSGQGNDVLNMDDKIRSFTLTPTERFNLIAFLHTLTDESDKPEIPESVPSGYDVVKPLQNQSPELAAFLERKPDRPKSHFEKTGNVITVIEGQFIQDAIDMAVPGDTVLVKPGT